MDTLTSVNPYPLEEFAARLRATGENAYHHRHPFHVEMNAGRLSPEALRIWIANRFYYQTRIPMKDGAILSNCPISEVRRMWLHRLTDHDGDGVNEGGIEAWLRLGEAAGLRREDLLEWRLLSPAARFAVDAYLHFAREQPWPVAIASSLTELFAPDLMAVRIAAFEQHYPWIAAGGLDYFRRRVTQARRDSNEGLDLTLRYCATRDLQEAAVAAMKFKCEVLWALCDAIEKAAAAAR